MTILWKHDFRITWSVRTHWSWLSVRYRRFHCIVSVKREVIYCPFYGLERCPRFFVQTLTGIVWDLRKCPFYRKWLLLGGVCQWRFHCNSKVSNRFIHCDHAKCRFNTPSAYFLGSSMVALCKNCMHAEEILGTMLKNSTHVHTYM